MKVYLNSRQKTSFTMMLACQQFLSQSVEKGEGYIPADVMANLKRGRTFTKKAMDTWLASLDTKTAKSVINMIRDYEITIQTNQQARQDPRRREQEALLSGAEYIERMAEISMSAKCSSCDGSCRDECPLYESFVHFSIPEYDPDNVNCPYAMLQEAMV